MSKKFPRSKFHFLSFFPPFKIWVFKSISGVVVKGPFKSEAALAKKLGLSQQYVNRQIRKSEYLFHLDGKKVIAAREKAFIAGKQTFYTKSDMAIILGVPQEVIERVFKKKSSGVIQTPKGKIKIAKLKPGETPIPLQPQVRPTICLWNEENEKQEFSSFAAAAKELKIDPKTIPNALKAGKDSFSRKSDGRKFTIEILEPTSPKVTKQRAPEKAPAVEKEEEKPPATAAKEEKDEEKTPEAAQKKDAAENEKEEFDETDNQPEEDPFWDELYEQHCPGVGRAFDIAFNKNKKKPFKTGRKG